MKQEIAFVVLLSAFSIVCSRPTHPLLRLIRVKTVQDIVCPDQTQECPSGNTCCQLSNGNYGCCPQPNAVCCSDNLHCCPHGYICNQNTCTQSAAGELADVIDGTDLTRPASKLTEVNNVICDKSYQCRDGNTCCRSAHSPGGWGCCPIPVADNPLCCSTYCCPEGFTCSTDSSEAKCIPKKSSSVPQLAVIEPPKKTSPRLKNVICDNNYQCPNGDTCCLRSGGDYGCCPSLNAVCCNDGLHCCPNGYACTCNTANGTCACIQDAVAPMPSAKISNVVVCPNGRQQCSDTETCCLVQDGMYGCCPLPNAVCCSDQTHCCPSGYTCDTPNGSCIRGTSVVPMLKKQSAIEASHVKIVVCDKYVYCSDGYTCCKLSTGKWGCCPVPNGVCCNDQRCCPEDYTCIDNGANCTKHKIESIMPSLAKKKPITAVQIKNVQCDQNYFCPGDDTCCRQTDGVSWGCCPLSNAVCCPNNKCCPSGYTCVGDHCYLGASVVPMLKKEFAIMLSLAKKKPVTAMQIKDVQCNQNYSCPDGNTCCLQPDNSWSCCPNPNGVCCAGNTCCSNGNICCGDNKCCPNGNTCCTDGCCPDSGVCCSDNKCCPNGNTCCSGGCCPDFGVCCPDNKCCPNGYTCAADDRCVRGTSVVPMLKKEFAIMQSEKPAFTTMKIKVPVDVECDEEHFCANGDTCCKLQSGDWGCCPRPNAVCCSDGLHCCPNGFTCNADSSQCLQTMKSHNIMLLPTTVPASKKQPAMTKQSNKICPDQQSECKDGSTCCWSKDKNAYGCCPLVDAVCCSDGEHCCPSDHTCDNGTGTCIANIIRDANHLL